MTGPGIVDMKALGVRLKDADPLLKRNLRKRLKAQAGPTVRDVQDAIRTMPVLGSRDDKPPSVREEIAKTVSASVGIGRRGVTLAIVSYGRKMPQGMEHLPALFDRAKGFKHPVFAQGARWTMGPSRARKYRDLPEVWRPMVHRGRWAWAHQEGRPGWFELPVILNAPELRRAVQDAVSDTMRHLEGH